ncbi:nucleotide pyrophosphohydrolase [soil metagenome]
MNDSTTTLNDLKLVMKKFVEERDWQQFHTPKNLAMNIAAEAAELMELFLWVDSADAPATLEKNRAAVEDEVADICCGLINFCLRNNIDIASAIEKKLVKNAAKYPVDKCKGKAVKYNLLD